MKTYLITLFAVLLTTFSLAQNGINYKAVIKDATGNVITNTQIAIQFKILQDAATGILVYSETHSPVTNANGLIIVNIGQGAPITGTFEELDWANHPHFLKVEIDTGAGLVNMGTNEFKTVPYAINALTSSDHTWKENRGDITNANSGNIGIGVLDPKTKLHIASERLLIGTDTIGAGAKLMWLPDLHAFRVGTLSNPTSNYWNRDSIGLYSFASGIDTRAQGKGATAMGRNTEASEDYAFASGFFSNAYGQYSTAMGFNTDALGYSSTALGYGTDAENSYSIALGYYAKAEGIYSVAIGNAVQAQSHSSMAIGRYNVGGGDSSSWNSYDPIFEIGIGTGPTFRANAVTVKKDGNVGIGTSNPLATLHVNGRIRFQTIEYFEDGGEWQIASNGSIRPTINDNYDLGTPTFRWDDVYATNGIINTSDMRDKTNINSLTYGLSEIMKLKPVEFNWKEKPSEEKNLGLIAQDLLEVIPEVVKTHYWQAVDENENSKQVRVEMDRMGVYYSDLIPVLIKGMQEQQDIIEALLIQISELSELTINNLKN